MKSFITTIRIGMWMLLCSLCTIACTDENTLGNNKYDSAGKAIQITVSKPDNHTVSRAAATEKDQFTKGDIIHISTTFTFASGTTGTTPVYSCLQYNGTKWVEHDTKTFTWPWNAEKASFTAYYIPSTEHYENSSMLMPGNVPILFSDLSLATVKNGTDPLVATYTEVPAGSSVYLQFEHILTKVTFTNLNKKLDGSSIKEGEELRLIIGNLISEQIVFTREDNNNLKHELTNDSKTTIGYVFNKCEGNEITFLLPAQVQDTKFKLAHKDMSAYHSLELPQELAAGKHYIIDVEKLADNALSNDIREEDWNKDIAPETLNSDGIQEYLRNIRDGKECTINGKQILITYLDENQNSVVAQIRDVDFNNQKFTPVNIGSNIIFQGNNHKIKNLSITKTVRNDDYEEPGVTATGDFCKALFGKNKGIIKNLVIEKATIKDGSTDEIYAGILAGENIGTIQNVKIQGATIANSSAQYIGLLAGSNSKTIDKCSISENINININQANAPKDIYIGGFVGYASGSTQIADCWIQGGETNHSISIEGSYNKNCYVGGMIGLTESMKQCTTNLDITVNATGNLFIGGFAGQIQAEEVTNCTAIGKIDATSTTNANIGGFVGMLLNAALYDCAASGTITATSGVIGGLVGKMNAAETKSEITYSSATGELSNDNGAFIGTAVKDKGTLSIGNCFSINKATSFIKEGKEYITTLTQCHLKGNDVTTNTTFNPNGDVKWTNTPPIYGDDIYYLKRELLKTE